MATSGTLDWSLSVFGSPSFSPNPILRLCRCAGRVLCNVVLGKEGVSTFFSCIANSAEKILFFQVWTCEEFAVRGLEAAWLIPSCLLPF